ncbi:MAG TPA: VCBS repeat-containing protein [Candidatus Hydrogenedentes bacterium]|nr:VCBS repeat-containing protein [Candidatus Hydrogenedentota bacterium]
MMEWIIALGCCGFGVLFNVNAIPMDSKEAVCFLAEVDDDGVADLFIINGNALSIYPDAESTLNASIHLPPGVSAIDVADITGKGKGDLVAICGDRILHYSLNPASPEPNELFRLKTIFSDPAPRPYTHVLVIKRSGTPLLALPCDSTFEIRGLDGHLVESYPIGIDAPHSIAYGKPFNCVSVTPPHVGLSGTLELSVHRSVAIKPNLPADLLSVEMMGPMYRRSSTRQLREAADNPPETWPWFPLRTGVTPGEKVFYALDSASAPTTLVSIQQPNDKAPKRLSTGPIRQYPGAPFFVEDTLPDFNADGYVDLLLWRSPNPAPAVESLSRIALGGSWPLQIETHLYVPKNNRYASKTSSVITLQMPFRWFFSGAAAPLPRLVFLRDADGDGASDFGCATNPSDFALWRYGKIGFSEKPDFTYSFPETLGRIELQADLDGRGRTSIIFRGEKHFYVLKAAAPVSFPRAPIKPVIPISATDGRTRP